MAHCWMGYQEWLEETTGKPWYELPDVEEGTRSATCLLPDGHKGPHEWTPDDEIIIGIERRMMDYCTRCKKVIPESYLVMVYTDPLDNDHPSLTADLSHNISTLCPDCQQKLLVWLKGE